MSNRAANQRALDLLIDPAPAEVSVDERTRDQNERIREENERIREENERKRKIKNFKEQARLINNICGPMEDYINFKQNLPSETKIIMDINQWIMTVLSTKALIITNIENIYSEIEDPPKDIKNDMSLIHENITKITTKSMESLNQMVNFIQERKTQNTNILPKMNSNSKK